MALNGIGCSLIPKTMGVNNDLKYFDIDIKKNINISYIGENLSPSSKEFLTFFKGDIDKYK